VTAETMEEDVDMIVLNGDEVIINSDVPAGAVCRVCGDSAIGMYFGALVCVPCKVCVSTSV